mmetsp:Transcript_1918/g.4588  ORF Transcript_1918/g.4588 Transcript_1918/m.4588 type:complete len:132 (+) Transcript_1918:1-396(+)
MDVQEFLGVGTLVDVSDFSPPAAPPPGETDNPQQQQQRLVRNPLAWIQPVATIVKHYKPEWEDRTRHLYLLNVNYAGNEMHESSIRVLIRDTEESSSPESINLKEISSSRLQCYVHYGLYCWNGDPESVGG